MGLPGVGGGVIAAPSALVEAQQHSHWPSFMEFLPTGHSLHSTLPGPEANLPDGHARHESEPAVAVNRPQPHSLHSRAIGSSALPAGHASQMPVSAFAILPAGQFWHSVEAGLGADLPLAHSVQAAAPSPPPPAAPSQAPASLLNLPGLQSLHSVAPARSVYRPGSQRMQALALPAPPLGENLPQGHDESHLPLMPLLPAGHSLHVPLSTPPHPSGVEPSGHAQGLQLSALAAAPGLSLSNQRPSGQLSQLPAVPCSARNWPGGHLSHGEHPPPVLPALHSWQTLGPALPVFSGSAGCLPFAQHLHSDCPCSSWYLPPGHGLQSQFALSGVTASFLVVYLPAGHFPPGSPSLSHPHSCRPGGGGTGGAGVVVTVSTAWVAADWGPAQAPTATARARPTSPSPGLEVMNLRPLRSQ